MDAFVVVACPEERHSAVRNELAHHVEGSEGTLVKGNVPMLCSHALAIDPVWVRYDVTSSKDVVIAGLKEWIARDTTVLLHIQANVGEELCRWGHTLAEDNEVNFDFAA